MTKADMMNSILSPAPGEDEWVGLLLRFLMQNVHSCHITKYFNSWFTWLLRMYVYAQSFCSLLLNQDATHRKRWRKPA